ncbi:MAG: hypothetical protein CL827_04170 [Crocinitomicaceae bacterium]|nr:hypothetical protein [Crocinitomicaceae bacterium]
MNNIDPIIKELLKLHDCVIFPGLGGFVAQYASSSISDDNLTFKPPFKQILFNKNLTNNDGLLANSISKEWGISYEESVEKISSLLFKINNEIKTNKQFSFEGIGVLYEVNGILNFKQQSENLLLESFGLRSINMNDFLIQSSEAKIIPIKSKSDAKQIIKNWSVAAAVIVLLFYSAWIPLKTNLFNRDSDFSYSDLNPFTFSKRGTSQEIKSNLVHKVPLSSDNTVSKSLIKTKKEIKKEIKKPINISSHNKTKSLSYEVIIGSFGEEKNAKNLIKKLRKKSFKARQLPFFKQLFRVSAGKFSNKKNAVEYQKQIKKKLHISSWILIK